MRFSSFLTVTALAAAAAAAPTADHVLHERRSASTQWVKGARVHGDVKLPVRIGLTQNNLDQGADLLDDISDPESKNYGNYLSAEAVHDLFAPSQASVDAVRGWLAQAGIAADRVSQSVNKQWLQLDLKTSEAEALLGSRFHFFEHTPTGKTSIACDEYHVGESVSSHIDYITPGIRLYATKGKRTAAHEIAKRTFGVTDGHPVGPSLQPLPLPLSEILALPLSVQCGVAITPACIRELYNFTIATSAVAGNELGIFEDLGDYYSQTDLNEFFATLQPRIPEGTHPTLHGIDGATAPAPVQSAGPESDLDFQISYPIIWPQNSILFQTDDSVYEANYTYDGFLNNFLDAIDGSYCSYSAYGETGNSPLDPPYPDPQAGGYKGNLQCGVYKPTNVISISYGGEEFDLPASYQKRQCNEFMKLGLQGVSFIISSGDSGVAGPAGDDSSNGCLNGGTVFNPGFPVTCPYVTAVGSTVLPPGGNAATDSETSTTRFGSGGGFSNIYAPPSYQKAAVANYLKNHKPSYPSYAYGSYGNGLYNRTGRGYPDVAAIGDNIVIYNMGAPTLIGGTSASAPTFAGILTRINDARLSAGKKPVGFVNPTLYKNPSALHDITVGNNPGCGTNGFNATVGWDPVSGLGTPNYPALLEVFMALP